MMNYIKWRPLFSLFGSFLLAGTFVSCQDELLDKVNVYSNDFSNLDSSNIINAKWHEFNGDSVLGWYYNEEISINIPSLPYHNTVEITIELLIHDSWDGNPDDIGGSDFWFMHLDGEEIVNTTFSNTPCGYSFCLYQSYPENYPRSFEPKTGAINTSLPGRCQYKGVPGWTSKYRITKLVKHERSNLTILCGDKLKQLNTTDRTCDESWSISKIEVNTLTVK
ncbi:MAG: hypothetical protein WD426_09770 [Anditalea sp.]